MRNLASKFAVIFALTVGLLISGTSHNAEAATSLPMAALHSADSQKGAKYVWGHEGPYVKGYDCSGLTYWAYRQHGKKIPRTAQDQYNHSKHVSPSNRKPGDLIFIKDSRGRVYHVGIFTGVKNHKGYILNANYGRTTKHIVGTWPVTNYTFGSDYASYGRYSS